MSIKSKGNLLPKNMIYYFETFVLRLATPCPALVAAPTALQWLQILLDVLQCWIGGSPKVTLTSSVPILNSSSLWKLSKPIKSCRLPPAPHHPWTWSLGPTMLCTTLSKDTQSDRYVIPKYCGAEIENPRTSQVIRLTFRIIATTGLNQNPILAMLPHLYVPPRLGIPWRHSNAHVHGLLSDNDSRITTITTISSRSIRRRTNIEITSVSSFAKLPSNQFDAIGRTCQKHESWSIFIQFRIDYFKATNDSF